MIIGYLVFWGDHTQIEGQGRVRCDGVVTSSFPSA